MEPKVLGVGMPIRALFKFSLAEMKAFKRVPMFNLLSPSSQSLVFYCGRGVTSSAPDFLPSVAMSASFRDTFHFSSWTVQHFVFSSISSFMVEACVESMDSGQHNFLASD